MLLKITDKYGNDTVVNTNFLEGYWWEENNKTSLVIKLAKDVVKKIEFNNEAEMNWIYKAVNNTILHKEDFKEIVDINEEANKLASYPETVEAVPTGNVVEDINPDNPNLYFLLKQGDNEFAISISTLLQCLEFASQEKYIPKIPFNWLSRFGGMYKE